MNTVAFKETQRWKCLHLTSQNLYLAPLTGWRRPQTLETWQAEFESQPCDHSHRSTSMHVCVLSRSVMSDSL